MLPHCPEDKVPKAAARPFLIRPCSPPSSPPCPPHALPHLGTYLHAHLTHGLCKCVCPLPGPSPTPHPPHLSAWLTVHFLWETLTTSHTRPHPAGLGASPIISQNVWHVPPFALNYDSSPRVYRPQSEVLSASAGSCVSPTVPELTRCLSCEACSQHWTLWNFIVNTQTYTHARQTRASFSNLPEVE